MVKLAHHVLLLALLVQLATGGVVFHCHSSASTTASTSAHGHFVSSSAKDIGPGHWAAQDNSDDEDSLLDTCPCGRHHHNHKSQPQHSHTLQFPVGSLPQGQTDTASNLDDASHSHLDCLASVGEMTNSTGVDTGAIEQSSPSLCQFMPVSFWQIGQPQTLQNLERPPPNPVVHASPHPRGVAIYLVLNRILA